MTRRERLGLIKVSILPRESLVLVCKMQAIGADLEWTALSCYGHRQSLQIPQEREKVGRTTKSREHMVVASSRNFGLGTS